WDPVAADYRSRGGWVRLHTNYAWHRAAALRALGLPPGADRAGVAAAMKERDPVDVEEAVHAEGGAAAALRSHEAWAAHPPAAEVGRRPLIALESGSGLATATAPDAHG